MRGFEFLNVRFPSKALCRDMPQTPVFAAFLYNAVKLHILVFDSVKGKLKGKLLVVN